VLLLDLLVLDAAPVILVRFKPGMRHSQQAVEWRECGKNTTLKLNKNVPEKPSPKVLRNLLMSC